MTTTAGGAVARKSTGGAARKTRSSRPGAAAARGWRGPRRCRAPEPGGPGGPGRAARAVAPLESQAEFSPRAGRDPWGCCWARRRRGCRSSVRRGAASAAPSIRPGPCGRRCAGTPGRSPCAPTRFRSPRWCRRAAAAARSAAGCGWWRSRGTAPAAGARSPSPHRARGRCVRARTPIWPARRRSAGST